MFHTALAAAVAGGPGGCQIAAIERLGGLG
jgi:hypothetical protein